MTLYVRNLDEESEESEKDVEYKRDLYKNVRFYRNKIRKIMARYLPIYDGARELHIQGKLWDGSVWRNLISQMTDIYDASLVIYDDLRLRVYKPYEKHLDKMQRLRFRANVFDEFENRLLPTTKEHIGISHDPKELMARTIADAEKTAEPSARLALVEEAKKQAAYENAEWQLAGYEKFSVVADSLRQIWTGLYFATLDAPFEIETLTENETEIWHKQLELATEIEDWHPEESFKSYIERLIQARRKVKEGGKTKLETVSLNGLEFIKKVVETNEARAQRKFTVVQVFDAHGELVWVATPSTHQVLSEVGKHLRLQHIHMKRDWESKMRGSNVITHGKRFARWLTPAETVALTMYLEDQKFRKDPITIDELSTVLNVPIKADEKELRSEDPEKRAKRSAEAVARYSEREARRVEMLKKQREAKRAESMTPNVDEYIDDLVFLKTIWQVPLSS